MDDWICRKTLSARGNEDASNPVLQVVCVGPPQAVSYTLLLDEDLGRRTTTSAERVALDWMFYA